METTGKKAGTTARNTNGGSAPTAPTTAAYSPEGHRHAFQALSILSDGEAAEQLIQAHVAHVVSSSAATSSAVTASPSPSSSAPISPAASALDILAVGSAALDAFLQANVTGPVLAADSISSVEDRFAKAWTASQQSTRGHTSSVALHDLRKACVTHLEVDGVSPYGRIPYLELFSLARFVFIQALGGESGHDLLDAPQSCPIEGGKCSVAWMRLRMHVWHYKLLTQPSLGPGSNFTKSSQWSEVPTLTSIILDSMDALSTKICGDEVWSTSQGWNTQQRAQFLVEAANNYILLGHHDKALNTLKSAAQTSGVRYALSGALGKRTRFQENSTSQLVVLARSAREPDAIPAGRTQVPDGDIKPDALRLNDDTLLEEIRFAKDGNETESKADTLPPDLADLSPDDQPQLSAVDQIILLTEATLKDAFSPADTLTSEEVMPFAVRVLSDKSTNWQIYTQALLVRSRIELHRSRTLERGVLQLQAVADQVVADTSGASSGAASSAPEESAPGGAADVAEVPAIRVTTPGPESAAADRQAPTTFLPAPKPSESAPAPTRLRYIHALSSPPRWHLESELAYAWAGVGSLASALEIFKRLHLWAEVALCLASAASSHDEDGRGSGGEEKAKAIIRWRLFHPTGGSALSSTGADDDCLQDVTTLKPCDYSGPERSPPPPNAARLWCILGDLEDDPAHYERAWEISNHRYARAQKSLGEYYLRRKDWHKARGAYRLATAVNRLSPEMWSRLGDISLRLGQFEDAAEAFGRSIGSSTDTVGGEDARTWSNLGSSLWSLYCEVIAETKNADVAAEVVPEQTNGSLVDMDAEASIRGPRDPSTLLSQSLAAYKKGASIAHDNWRIWDNVLTLASRLQPPAVTDIVLAYQHILRIRQNEDAIDTDVLSALLQDVVLTKDRVEAGDSGTGVYDPPRGSTERLVCRLVEEDIIPLITRRAELWALVARLRIWRRDYVGAIDASERAWRAAVGSSGGGSASLLPGEPGPASSDWTADEAAWGEVVKRTDELVSLLENWGPSVESVGPRWRGKARNAVRSVMGRAKENWEGSEGWKTLESLMEGLKVA